MVFGDDLKGELFNKIGATGGEDPFQLFKDAKNELGQGNHAKAKETFEKIVSITTANTERLMSQKQHRSAAEQYFIKSKAHEMLEQTDLRDAVLTKVVDSLLAASKTARDFGEDNRGITAHSLAGIVCITKGDEDRAFQIYNEGMELSDGKPNVEALKKIMYSLGYLLDSLRNNNIAALTDAQNFISTNLRPMLTSSKMTGFEGLLDEIIGFTSNILESRIKLPTVEIATTYPRDLLFNTTYEIKLGIENTGEGDAKNLEYQINIQDDLELVSGELSESFETFAAGTKIEKALSIRFMAADKYEEKSKITGHLKFVDMLNNSRRQILSPIEMEFRSVSKASEYQDKVDKMIATYNEVKQQDTDNLPSELVSNLNTMTENLKGQIVEAINHENFENAEYGMSLLETVISTNKVLLGTQTEPSGIGKQISEIVETEKQKLNEELTNKYNTENEEALASQKAIHDQEIETLRSSLKQENDQLLQSQQNKFDAETQKLLEDHNKTITEVHAKNDAEKASELKALETSLTSKYENQIEKLKQEKEAEITRINTTTENKIKQQIADKESEIRAQHKATLQAKNDETEKAIREIQDEYSAELVKAKDTLKKELEPKHQEDLKNVEQQLDVQKSHLDNQAKEEKENALKNLEAKLQQEKQEEIDAIERKAALQYEKKLEDKEVEMKRELETSLKQKNKEIEDLRRRIEVLESGEN